MEKLKIEYVDIESLKMYEKMRAFMRTMMIKISSTNTTVTVH